MIDAWRKVVEHKKCGICAKDFVGCQDPNQQIKLPCGCTFHEYCLRTYNGTHRCASAAAAPYITKCDKCKDFEREIQRLTSKLMEKVDNLGSSNDPGKDDLRKENMRLVLENSKLKERIERAYKSLEQAKEILKN